MSTKQIERLFDEVVDLTPTARAAHLKARCGSDLDLLRQLESIVAAYDHVTTLLGRFEPSGPSDASAARPAERDALPSHRRYRISREIGRGGMGVIYLATDVQLDRPVALKFLPASIGADPDARMRLFAEARAAAGLDHPNIGTIYDVGQSDDGRLFIAMAYCPGESLRSRLERGPLRLRDAVRVAMQVAEGLAVAHRHGLVHRDIKPANLLLTAPDLVKIVDFGIAERIQRDSTRRGEIAGTLAYMSPEQACGGIVDARTDVWSLGVTLYEMLTGRRPFHGENPVALLHAILHDRPRTLAETLPDAPAAVQRILDRSLAKDPAARYAAAEDLLADLRQVMFPAASLASSVIPRYLTSFVGRQHELQQARAALTSARLLTLTGPPGTGKTRLAVQLASEMHLAFPDGQVFVPLAAIQDPALLPSALAQALGLRIIGNLPALEAVRDHLGERQLLLVLDNFEQLLPAAPMVADLVAACRGLSVLVTSRASLRLSGEQELPVPPLTCPPATGAGSLEEIERSDAVALFIHRAQAIQPGFQAEAEATLAVGEICRRLDGLPLAIELAAARVKVLSPRAILARLEKRLDLLSGGSRDAPSRHQTLRQAVAWSYGLLTSAERKLLRQLAVFNGGFTLDAVEALVGRSAETLDALGSLVDNNLVRQGTSDGDEPRFSMLETIREFSLECLRGAGEEGPARAAHGDYYLELLERAARDLDGPDQARRFDELEREHDNLRAAFEWSLAAGDAETAERVAAGLWRFWLVRGHLREGRDRLQSVLTNTPTASPRHLTLLTAAGTLAHNLGDYDAAQLSYQQAVDMARLLADDAGTARALSDLGWAAWRRGEYAAARALSVESLALHRRLNDARGIANALTNLGWIAHHEGDFRSAEALHRQSLEIREIAGDTRGTGFSLVNLAWALLQQGDLITSRELLTRGRALLDQIGERQLYAFAGVILGACERRSGEPARALEVLEQSAAIFRSIGDRYGVAAAQAGKSMVNADLGEREGAAALAAEALLLRRQIGDRWGEADCLAFQAHLAELQGHDRAAIELWQHAVEIWGALGDGASVAECLTRLARLTEAADAAAAARLQDAASDIRLALASPRHSGPPMGDRGEPDASGSPPDHLSLEELLRRLPARPT